MQEVSAYVQAHRDSFLNDLMAACRTPSVFKDSEGLRTMAQWVQTRLQAAGCEVDSWEVAGGPPIVWGEVGSGPRSLLSYSHYDVQPADPLDLWHSPPFDPTVRDGKIFARGVADDKGDLMSRIHAVETYRAVYGDLPVRFKFFVEGEEEVGSPHLAPVAMAHAQDLQADGCLWESGEFDSQERYRVYLGVKGIQYVELRVRGANTDLHSSYATIVPNPAWRLVQALNTLKAPDDTITVDGYLDYVRPLTPLEEAYLDRIPFDGEDMKEQWGIPAFINEIDNREALKRFLYAPTCTICGLRSGFIDEGQKTVLPATAMAKLDFRLVPDLTPDLVIDLLPRPPGPPWFRRRRNRAHERHGNLSLGSRSSRSECRCRGGAGGLWPRTGRLSHELREWPYVSPGPGSGHSGGDRWRGLLRYQHACAGREHSPE